MATSKDFEKLWNRYQDEVQATGKSIVTFCQENGIVYAQFERWYKKRGSSLQDADAPKPEVSKRPNQDPMWIRSFTIQFRNGLEIRHQNISYSSLASLVEKLEGLC